MSVEPIVATLFTSIGGAVLLLVPGALVLSALGASAELSFEERPAHAFAVTLALLAVPATVSGFRPVPLAIVLAWLATVSTVAATFVLSRARTRRRERMLAILSAQREPRQIPATPADLLPAASAPTASRAGRVVEPTPPSGALRREAVSSAPRALIVVATIAAVLLTCGAYALTRGGSVDRWWYLAFVRAFLREDAMLALDPLLGTPTTLARFACNAWLAALAAWARATGSDPVLIYERAAPVLLAPLALSAAASSVRWLLRDRRASLAAVVIAAAFWTSGGPFPALTRLPEDKILAALVLAPVLWATVVRVVGMPSHARTTLVAAALCAIALATVHPLVFVIALVTIAPTLLLARRRIAVALALTLAVVGMVPVAIGLGARTQLEAASSLDASEHPVSRIHLSRARVSEGEAGLFVDPRLIASPLALLALATLPVLAFRGARARALFVLPSLAALALCFLPPLTALLARAVTPWMVYRFLWAIPFVPLLAVLARAAAKRMPLGYTIPLACMIALAVPAMSTTLARRTAEARTALATPDSDEFRTLVAALRALPAASVIAAAPELSERIPGLSGRRVLAASDRATLVFAGDASAAATRLRDRAAVLAGIWRQSDGIPPPTHVLFAPGAPAARYCNGARIHASPHYELCAFVATEPPPGMKLGNAPPAPESASVGIRVALDAAAPSRCRLACEPAREPAQEPVQARRNESRIVFPRPGPWSARAPGVACTLDARACDAATGAVEPLRPRTLELEVVTGRAVEELTVVARAERDGSQRWNLRTRAVVRDGDGLRYALPSSEVDRIEIALIPSRLPFVKLDSLAVVIENTSPALAPQ